MARGKPSLHGKKLQKKKLVFSFTTFLILLGKPILYFSIGTITSLIFATNTVKLLSLTLHSQLIQLKKSITIPKLIPLHLPKVMFKTNLGARNLKKKNSKKTAPTQKVTQGLRRRFWIRAFAGLVAAFAIMIIGSIIVWQEIVKDLPTINGLASRIPPVSTKIYDRNGELLYTMYKDENRRLVTLDDVPLIMRQSTLAAEDAQFYSHPGISFKGISRATLKYFQTGQVTSGSTISQQLVKNIYLTPEKTFLRKLREIILAFQLERTFTKNQILEMYLNEVPYGGTAYGVEQASQVYFGKSIANISVHEAAFLAGLPKSPSRFSPFSGNNAMAVARQHEVLNLMRENGFINESEHQTALSTALIFAENKQVIKAPHFVEYVRQELEALYGDSVASAGLTVRTTLDLKLQEQVQQLVSREVDSLEKLSVSNGAAIVVKPKTGEILAMVGSKDYYNDVVDGFVNVVTRPRQPGSSIKLITYAYALSHGMTPATVLEDSPVTFTPKGGKPYTPQNYDGQYRGKISLRSAFAESRNVPAVRVINQYGVEQIIEQGRKMGITSWVDPRQYGLSLTLGGGEITLYELSGVYATLANMGTYVPLSPFLDITNNRGLRLAYLCGEASHFNTNNCQNSQALDPRVAYQLIDILKDNSARSPSFGTRSALVIPSHPEVAVKTGTSNNLRDNLTVGFNQDYVVATWVGNNDGSPMSRVASGVTGASPMWNKIMISLLTDKPSVAWTPPSGLTIASACAPCDGCGNKQEYFLQENIQTRPCTEKNLAEKKIEDARQNRRRN